MSTRSSGLGLALLAATLLLCLPHHNCKSLGRGLLQQEPPQAPPPPPPAYSCLWELVQNRSELATLRALLEGTGLEPLLNGTTADTAVTMLLPTNSAFEALYADMGITDPEQMQATLVLPVLLYHIHGTVMLHRNFTPGLIIQMASADNVTVNSTWDRSIELRDMAGRTARVLEWDLIGGPSVGHIIDSVLLPISPSTIGEALSWSNLTTFREVFIAGGYESLLNSSMLNITILAPTDDAFQAALSGLNISNMTELLANKTLCKDIVSIHILLGLHPWWQLQGMQLTYLPTGTSCTNIYVEQEDSFSPLYVYGAGAAVGQSTVILQADLAAGKVPILHIVDAVLLPLSRWGVRCRYALAS